MKPRDYVLAAVNHEETDRVPYTLDFEDEPAAELDAHYGTPRWRDRLQSCMVSVGWVDAVAESPIDKDHYKDAFGSTWRGDKRPFHLVTPAMPGASFEGVHWPTIDDFPYHFAENMSELTGADSERFSIIHNGWGIFEIAWRVRGFENMLMDCIAEEDFFVELLDRLTDLRLQMVEKCKDVPADAIFFGDDWGDQRGVIIGPERWRKLVKPRWAKIYDAVHEQGKYVISHCCGSIVDILPDLIEIGLDVYESVQPEPRGMNPFQLKEDFGDKITFWGCLGSQSTIQFGTPDEIKNQVRKLSTEMSRNGGYILAPSKTIQPGTPLENSVALVEAFSAM